MHLKSHCRKKITTQILRIFFEVGPTLCAYVEKNRKPMQCPSLGEGARREGEENILNLHFAKATQLVETIFFY